MKKYQVYRFVEQETGKTKYIGITNNIQLRTKQHFSQNADDDWWVRGNSWVIETLVSPQVITKADALSLETHLIALYENEGLYNIEKIDHGLISAYSQNKSDYIWQEYTTETIPVSSANTKIQNPCSNNYDVLRHSSEKDICRIIFHIIFHVHPRNWNDIDSYLKKSEFPILKSEETKVLLRIYDIGGIALIRQPNNQLYVIDHDCPFEYFKKDQNGWWCIQASTQSKEENTAWTNEVLTSIEAYTKKNNISLFRMVQNTDDRPARIEDLIDISAIRTTGITNLGKISRQLAVLEDQILNNPKLLSNTEIMSILTDDLNKEISNYLEILIQMIQQKETSTCPKKS